MKSFKASRSIAVLVLLSNVSPALAAELLETTVFSAPAEYCVEQTSLRGTLKNTILEHHLIIPPEDHFKAGDIFVAARFKSRPDEIWLTNGVSWRTQNSNGPLNVYRASEQMNPVIPISVFFHPMDVSAVVGDGQIWVGYGLRSEMEDARISFNEMLTHGRYDLIWEAGSAGVGADGISRKICFTTTGMTTSVFVGGTNPPNPVGNINLPDPDGDNTVLEAVAP